MLLLLPLLLFWGWICNVVYFVVYLLFAVDDVCDSGGVCMVLLMCLFSLWYSVLQHLLALNTLITQPLL